MIGRHKALVEVCEIKGSSELESEFVQSVKRLSDNKLPSTSVPPFVCVLLLQNKDTRVISSHVSKEYPGRRSNVELELPGIIDEFVTLSKAGVQLSSLQAFLVPMRIFLERGKVLSLGSIAIERANARPSTDSHGFLDLLINHRDYKCFFDVNPHDTSASSMKTHEDFSRRFNAEFRTATHLASRLRAILPAVEAEWRPTEGGAWSSDMIQEKVNKLLSSIVAP